MADIKLATIDGNGKISPMPTAGDVGALPSNSVIEQMMLQWLQIEDMSDLDDCKAIGIYRIIWDKVDGNGMPLYMMPDQYILFCTKHEDNFMQTLVGMGKMQYRWFDTWGSNTWSEWDLYV